MKKFLSFCFLLFAAIANAQKPCTSYLLNGKISHAEGEWLYIKRYDYKTYHLVDSVQVKNGSVAMQLSFHEPTRLLLICKDKRAINLVNCGTNSFTWDISRPASFSMQDNGISKYENDYQQRIVTPITDRIVEISQQLRELENNQAAWDSLNNIRMGLQRKLMLQTMAFIREHRHNFVSLYLLRYYYPYLPVDTVRALFALQAKGLKSYPAAKTIQAYLDLEKKQLPLRQLTYSSGKDSLAGFDFYVVDFWGSWCGPCIASIPAVKSLYQEWRPRNIQFVSIAYEKAKDLAPYHKAQEALKMPWPQAYVVKNGEDTTLIEEYYIAAFPTYFILDKNFKILYRLATHGELKGKLERL